MKETLGKLAEILESFGIDEKEDLEQCFTLFTKGDI